MRVQESTYIHATPLPAWHKWQHNMHVILTLLLGCVLQTDRKYSFYVPATWASSFVSRVFDHLHIPQLIKSSAWDRQLNCFQIFFLLLQTMSSFVHTSLHTCANTSEGWQSRQGTAGMNVCCNILWSLPFQKACFRAWNWHTNVKIHTDCENWTVVNPGNVEREAGSGERELWESA